MPCAHRRAHPRESARSCASSTNVVSSPMPWDFWLIFAVLGVLLPWRGRARLQKLLAAPRINTVERLALYASTVAFQWIVAGVAAWRAWARGFRADDLGL